MINDFKIFKQNFIFKFIIVFLIFIFDRISKEFVIYLSEKSLVNILFTSSFLNINLIWNDGVAFGLLSFDELFFYNIVTMTIIIVVIILFVMIYNSSGLSKYSLLMILGGALGNLYDRIVFNSVPDFIDLHIGKFHWFIFNIADIFITVGIIIMIMTEFFIKKDQQYEK